MSNLTDFFSLSATGGGAGSGGGIKLGQQIALPYDSLPNADPELNHVLELDSMKFLRNGITRLIAAGATPPISTDILPLIRNAGGTGNVDVVSGAINENAVVSKGPPTSAIVPFFLFTQGSTVTIRCGNKPRAYQNQTATLSNSQVGGTPVSIVYLYDDNYVIPLRKLAGETFTNARTGITHTIYSSSDNGGSYGAGTGQQSYLLPMVANPSADFLVDDVFTITLSRDIRFMVNFGGSNGYNNAQRVVGETSTHTFYLNYEAYAGGTSISQHQQRLYKVEKATGLTIAKSMIDTIHEQTADLRDPATDSRLASNNYPQYSRVRRCIVAQEGLPASSPFAGLILTISMAHSADAHNKIFVLHNQSDLSEATDAQYQSYTNGRFIQTDGKGVNDVTADKAGGNPHFQYDGWVYANTAKMASYNGMGNYQHAVGTPQYTGGLTNTMGTTADVWDIRWVSIVSQNTGFWALDHATGAVFGSNIAAGSIAGHVNFPFRLSWWTNVSLIPRHFVYGETYYHPTHVCSSGGTNYSANFPLPSDKAAAKAHLDSEGAFSMVHSMTEYTGASGTIQYSPTGLYADLERVLTPDISSLKASHQPLFGYTVSTENPAKILIRPASNGIGKSMYVISALVGQGAPDESELSGGYAFGQNYYQDVQPQSNSGHMTSIIELPVESSQFPLATATAQGFARQYYYDVDTGARVLDNNAGAPRTTGLTPTVYHTEVSGSIIRYKTYYVTYTRIE